MSDDKNTPEAMQLDYYVRWYNKQSGEWQAVNVKDLTDEEFRQFICWKIGLIGMRKK